MQSLDAASASSSSSSNPRSSSWFSDLRTKLNQFNAADFFSNFGLVGGGGGGKQQNQTSTIGGGGRKGSSSTTISRSVMNLASESSATRSSIDESTIIDNESGGANNTSEYAVAAISARRSDQTRRKERSEPPFNNNLSGGDPIPTTSADDEIPTSARSSSSIFVELLQQEQEQQHFGTLTGLVVIPATEPAGVGHSFKFAPTGYPTWCDKCGEFISGLCEGQAVRCENCRYTCHVQCENSVTLDCHSSITSLLPTTDDDNLPAEAEAEAAEELVVQNGGECQTTDKLEEENKEPQPDDTGGKEKESILIEDHLNVGETLVAAGGETTESDAARWTEGQPRGEELRRLIEDYNRIHGDGLSMTMDDDGVSFRGFLRIHMNFARPINVVSGEQPASIYDVVGPGPGPGPWPGPGQGPGPGPGPGEEASGDDSSTSKTKNTTTTITSFYLPRNTVKVLHVTSETTTCSLISSLLSKFKVADSPGKFALYERDLGPGQTLQARLVRVPEDARPLRMALSAERRFVLQENETGDILWDAFEIPELQNFLKILDIEEQQYVKQIERRYYVYRYWLEEEIHRRLAARQA